MSIKLKTVQVILTREIAELLEAEVASGRFANVANALHYAAWKTFGEDSVTELRRAFAQLDESPDQAEPSSLAIASEIDAWRSGRSFHSPV